LLTVPLIACLALTSAPQIRGSDLLNNLVAKLGSAKTLQADFIFGNVDDVQTQFALSYQKPNLVRIESDSVLALSNGKEIVYYNKARNTFSRQPYDDEVFRELVTSPEVTVFGSFFLPNMFSTVADPIYSGPVTRGEKHYEGVKFKFNDDDRAVLYIDPTDKLVRQAEMDVQVLGDTRSFILNASSLKLNEQFPKGTYAFNPKAGAREVAPDSDVWYTKTKDAQRSAAATGRVLMLYFCAQWSPASLQLERSVFMFNSFKRTAGDFVFCKVDADEYPAVMKAYNVSNLPTVVFTRPNGAEVHRVTGRANVRGFLAQMQIAKQRAKGR
jgi:outer membrane lipoprotein-sorting protein